ncbi:aKG-HExxH-type peptide beta-hydroxylase [Bradyrhizobium sp. HKCCYLRH2060]|uniref:aKG-HExxH-type peptide beta-hydroxylase n=1 Tax=Bradyrhizobium TaxID=374 RepID=UPI002915CA45|nr:HEXXH motif-containing putative peptide modification protein [Bradyrhizobium sp. SZCCHNR3003]
MTITRMPDVLRWNDYDAVCDGVLATYGDRLAQKLGEALGEICRDDPAGGDELRSLMDRVADDGFMRVLDAPETSFRLLSAPGRHAEDKGRFLRDAFVAEALRQGLDVAADRDVWTALGDRGYLRDGACIWPQVEGMPVTDYGSPHALRVDLSGQDRPVPPPRPPFSDSEIDRLHDLLRRSRAALERTEAGLPRFVARFNIALILQKDPESPASFSSGSNGYYIGRTFLANPHLPEIDESHVADALVHEGIHALLYMQEQEQPWFLDSTAKGSLPRITSPWSGSRLPFPSFLQACFVWYGLLHFWSRAMQSGAFEQGVAIKRIQLCLRGFCKQPLLDSIAGFSSVVDADVQKTIEEMQNVVVGAFADVRHAG